MEVNAVKAAVAEDPISVNDASKGGADQMLKVPSKKLSCIFVPFINTHFFVFSFCLKVLLQSDSQSVWPDVEIESSPIFPIVAQTTPQQFKI